MTTESDLWRVGHDTVDVNGPMLAALLDRTLLPIWDRVLNQADARPEPSIWERLALLEMPRSAFTREVASRVVAGQATEVHEQNPAARA